MRLTIKAALLVLAASLGMAGANGGAAAGDAPVVKLTLKGHRFEPAEASAPAGKPFVLEVTNLDATPAEFESKPLRIEKGVPGGGSITVRVRALAAGRYKVFDDYNEATAVGFLVAQ